MGVFILHCEQPLPVGEDTSPNKAFLIACNDTMQGKNVWQEEVVTEAVRYLTDSNGSVTCEIRRREGGDASILLAPNKGDTIWVATRRGRDVKKIAKPTSAELSALDNKKDQRFYLMGKNLNNPCIEAIIYCSTF